MIGNPETPHQFPDTHTFIDLVIGLQSYVENAEEKRSLTISRNLRRALNALSLAMAGDFPKTLNRLMALCTQRCASWYPLDIPDGFDAEQPLLYDRYLSEEAQDYCLEISETLQITPASREDMPRTVLQNLAMIDLRRRLKEMPDNQMGQQLYTRVRSFLIEHSFTTQDRMHKEGRSVFQELRQFYEEVPLWPVENLRICDHCGVLEWIDGRWRGIKPGFCSNHDRHSGMVREIPNTQAILRLKRGNHLRTFLPGRLELALFQYAEDLQSHYEGQLPVVERYPGFDTYDLRLEFCDGDIWAIDAKDHAQARGLARHIRPLYREGALAYRHAFYVLPDHRMNDIDYRETLEDAMGVLPSDLSVISASVFRQRLEQKLKDLASPRKRRQQR